LIDVGDVWYPITLIIDDLVIIVNLVIDLRVRNIDLILDGIVVFYDCSYGGDIVGCDSWNWIGWDSLDGSDIGVIVAVIDSI